MARAEHGDRGAGLSRTDAARLRGRAATLCVGSSSLHKETLALRAQATQAQRRSTQLRVQAVAVRRRAAGA